MVELVQVVLAREDGPVGEHLSQNAAHRPDVNGLGIALRRGENGGFLGQSQQGPVVWATLPSQSISIPAREGVGRGLEELMLSFFPEPKDHSNVTRPMMQEGDFLHHGHQFLANS